MSIFKITYQHILGQILHFDPHVVPINFGKRDHSFHLRKYLYFPFWCKKDIYILKRLLIMKILLVMAWKSDVSYVTDCWFTPVCQLATHLVNRHQGPNPTAIKDFSIDFCGGWTRPRGTVCQSREVRMHLYMVLMQLTLQSCLEFWILHYLKSMDSLDRILKGGTKVIGGVVGKGLVKTVKCVVPSNPIIRWTINHCGLNPSALMDSLCAQPHWNQCGSALGPAQVELIAGSGPLLSSS